MAPDETQDDLEDSDGHDDISTTQKSLELDRDMVTDCRAEAVMAAPSKSTDAAEYSDLIIF